MSKPAGISGQSRKQLAQVVAGGQRFVTPERAAASLGLDERVAARKLARWADAGWLRRVRRGLYIPVPVDVEYPAEWSEDALVIAAAVWRPCYFTGWTSANHWGLSEQVFRTTILKTTTRVRQESVQLLGREYLVSHAKPDAMEWGIDTLWREELRLLIADPARTVIDVLDAPRLGGGIRNVGEVLRAYLANHDPSRLVEYGDRLGNRTVFKRLGYLLELLAMADNPLIQASRERVSKGVARLDPDAPVIGERVARWGLRANVRFEQQDVS
jgi:predicted transcriptional regulator of viral defense system